MVGAQGLELSFDSQALVEGEGKKAPIEGQGTISGAALTRKQRDGGCAMTSTIKISDIKIGHCQRHGSASTASGGLSAYRFLRLRCQRACLRTQRSQSVAGGKLV
jgi:hypothetical protein